MLLDSYFRVHNGAIQTEKALKDHNFTPRCSATVHAGISRLVLSQYSHFPHNTILSTVAHNSMTCIPSKWST